MTKVDTMKWVMRIFMAAVMSLVAFGSGAQGPGAADPAPDYPKRPVRLVVNAPPGGGTDILARLVAQQLTQAWGQQWVVDNRAGGGGIIGTETVARAQPDGYTLLMAFTSHVINPSLYRKLPYDTLKDFAPVAFVATVPNIVVVYPAVPVRSVSELIEYARARPGTIGYASAGSGSASHLAGVLFETMASIKLMHVPYKGGAPAQADVIAGHVPLAFANAVPALPHVRAGKLRGLATTGAKRSRAVPDLPTVDEAGVKGYEANAWFGLYAPARVVPGIPVKINAALRASMETPEVVERLTRQGAESNPINVAEFTAFVAREIERWAAVVKASGARVE